MVNSEIVISKRVGHYGITLDDFFKLLENYPCCDYIVKIASRHSKEIYYDEENVILMFEANDKFVGYVWQNDFDEGQPDIYVIGFIPLCLVDVFDIGTIKTFERGL